MSGARFQPFKAFPQTFLILDAQARGVLGDSFDEAREYAAEARLDEPAARMSFEDAFDAAVEQHGPGEMVDQARADA